MATVNLQVNRVFKECINNRNRYLMLYGGAGSGKSVFAAQKIILRLLSKYKHRFLIIRKVAKTIRNSQFKLFKDLIGQYKLNNFFEMKENEMNIVGKNGNEIISAGVDDSEKLKSITNISGIWIEETTELSEEDFRQIDLRLRGELPDYKQILMTFNPIYIGHWLNQIKLSDCYRLKTTYIDNSFIDNEYKKVLDDLKHQDENYYNVYALGNWGIIRNAERAYYNFKRESCVENCPVMINDGELIISYDFNVNPMCVVAVILSDNIYTQLNEWKLDHSNTEEISELVCEYLSESGIISSIIITGDASGRAKGTKGYMSDYEIIQKVFQKCGIKYYLRIPESNPPVRDRVNYVNKLFQTGKFKIQENCKYSIQDRELVTWKKGAEGFKVDKSDSELTHLSDAADYALWNTKAILYSETSDSSGIVLGGRRRW